MWTTLNFRVRVKTKKNVRDICERTLDIDTDRDWLVGLGPASGDEKKLKIYFSSFMEFSGKSRKCHIVVLRMYYKPTKFNQNRWSHFWENHFFYIFLMWTTLNFRVGGKTKKNVRDICERTLDIDFERDWWVSLGPALGNGKKLKIYFSSFRDFSGKSR